MVTRIRRAGRRAIFTLTNEEGATAVEYALMLALIAMVVVGAVMFLGQSTNSQFADPTLNGALGS
jgi:pilus assembly protein Flp/PilA